MSWSESQSWNKELERILIDVIKGFNDVDRPNLLIVGPVGAGKSSFINAILSIDEGCKVSRAQSGSCKSSFTVQYKGYSGKSLLKGFILRDTMGIEPNDEVGFHLDDFIYLVRGNIKNNYQFNHVMPITPSHEYYRADPEPRDVTSCVIFVVSAVDIYNDISKAFVRKIGLLQYRLRLEQIPSTLVLTKADLLCDEVSKDRRNMFRSKKIEAAVKHASEIFNMNRASIHPVVNYEIDYTITPEQNIPILLALKQSLRYANDHHMGNLEEDKDINQIVNLEGRLIEEIKGFNHKGRPNMLIMGPVAAGKSSFINAILSIGEGTKVSRAQSGSSASSFSLQYKGYSDKSLLKGFILRDTMGIEPRDGEGFHIDDFIYLLRGNIKNNYMFNCVAPITPSHCSYRADPEPQDVISCVIFVVSAVDIYNDISQAFIRKIGLLQDRLRYEQIPRTLILTKADLLCEEVQKDVGNILRSKKIAKTVKLASEVFHIDQASIHPVVNYEVKSTLVPEQNIPILLAIKQSMRYAIGHVIQREDDDDIR